MWWTIDFHFEATIPIIIRPRFTIFDHQKRQFQGLVVPYEKNRDQIVHFTRLEIHIQVRKMGFFIVFIHTAGNFDNKSFLKSSQKPFYSLFTAFLSKINYNQI